MPSKPDSSRSNAPSRAFTVAAAVSAAVFSTATLAAPWDFGAIIDVGLIHSDNIRLNADGEENGDTAGLLRPTFSLTTESDRLTADLRYRPEAFFYFDNSDANTVFHTLDSTLTTAFVRDALFLDLNAVNYQTVVLPEERVPTSNLPITGNRADSMVLEARPYWQQNLGFANVLADISYRDTSYSVDEPLLNGFIRDNQVKSGRFNLNNHELQEGLAWGIDYNYRRVEYDDAVPWDYQQASANLGYWINGTLRIFGSGGKESSFQNFFDPALEDSFWEGGIQYRPNTRLDFEIAVGDRSFGESYRANITYQLRRGQTSLTYTEAPSTRADVGGGRRPLVFTDILDNFLDRPEATDNFVRRRGQWMTTMQLNKSNWSLRLYSEERDLRTTEDGDPLDSERHYGGAFRWDWELGSRSTLGIEADAAKRDTGVAEGNLRRFAANYTYTFSEKLSVVASLRRTEEDGVGGAGRDYVENQAQLNFRFTLQ